MRKAGTLIDCSLADSGARCVDGPPLQSASARSADRGALGIDAGHQIVPGLDKGRGTLILEPGGQRVDVDTRLGEAGQNRLAVASVRCEYLADLAVVAEGLEGTLRHGVDGEGRGESLHIKGVRGFSVLCAVAGPEKALGAGARIGGALEARRGEQLPIRLVGALGDRDAEPIG